VGRGEGRAGEPRESVYYNASGKWRRSSSAARFDFSSAYREFPFDSSRLPTRAASRRFPLSFHLRLRLFDIGAAAEAQLEHRLGLSVPLLLLRHAPPPILGLD
jgi:hypothetical protein